MKDKPGPRFFIVAARSKPYSVLRCSVISDTRLHCRSENRSLKVVVSGSLASSRMLPTELALSESLSGMVRLENWVIAVEKLVCNAVQKFAQNCKSFAVASSCL
jgi:hypothetical protein